MDMEFEQQVGIPRYERGEERRDQRNGTRSRRFDTRMGTIDLEVPRLRNGTYFPSFLEPNTRSERAIIGLVQEAIISGVSTRKIHKLAAELGITSLSKSAASEYFKDLDEEARAFRERSLTGNYPYLFLDAVYEKVRIHRTVVSQACVIAYGERWLRLFGQPPGFVKWIPAADYAADSSGCDLKYTAFGVRPSSA